MTVLVLAAFQLARDLVPDSLDVAILARLAFVPGRLTFAFDPRIVTEPLLDLAGSGEDALRQAQVERFWLGDGTAQPWTVLTYALLHAGWVHLGLNSLWLLAFGSPVARRLGGGWFAALLAVASVAGAGAHYATHIADLMPVVGASAAVSGCMGGALRFMFQPQVPLKAMIGTVGQGRPEAFLQPFVPLSRLVRDRRAMTFFIAWFLTNLLFGLGALSFGAGTDAVAWQAHIGGFFAGLLLLPLFDRLRFRRAPPLSTPDA